MADIKKIHRLQDISSAMSCLGIDMPQIVAIGSQSSGKSSVLEQIIKREVLPRGTNLVTRCPIVLHLRRCEDGAEGVVFDHLAGSVDFGTAGSIIIKRMEEICGINKGISSRPITAFVNLKDTLEMTVVDLPGLIKVPIGEQPEDIEIQVEDMVLGYAMKDSSIILALVNANADIATNEALKIAKKADPQLKRTLGVVTKIDLMDAGTDCMNILSNRNPKLALGYIGVINRGQQDIAKGVSINEAIHKESKYFKENPLYGKIYPNIGSEYLIKRLNEIFYEKAMESVPGIKTAVKNQLNDKAKRLHEIESGNSVKREQSLVLDYHQAILEIFRHVRPNVGVFSKSSSGFLNELKKAFEEDEFLAIFEDLPSRLSRSSYIFISEAVFYDVVRENIKKMATEYLEKVDNIVKLLIKEIWSISSPSFAVLSKKLNGVVSECIEEQRCKLADSIHLYSSIQSSYINVNHPDFDRPRALSLILRKIPRSESGLLGMFNSKEVSFEDKAFEVRLIKELAGSYLRIVNKEMRNYVLKAIHYYLCEYMDSRLPSVLTELEIEETEMAECPEIVGERNSLAKDIEILKNALSSLSGF
ncbi:dynamin [Encephalitozoon intestinalis ATCC 50506]|uniref:Dynamin n=1 Tax=Encephalitozoon intestinalis (strain ATCC 50506) TaxID=876142 RepID=E0S5J1_ENCIT|nr:dynamin [Encephalitozoon intestinalis ATCC 50506]ADM10976.1 dynamin [Encephalitozoon intestinalis ATCC 50506]UTX44613.1 dynamin [Encephalitozoon intestinalis]